MKSVQKGQRIPSYQSEGKQCTDNVHKRLEHLVAPHVDSFNYFLDGGIKAAVNDILPIMIQMKPKQKVSRKKGAKNNTMDISSGDSDSDSDLDATTNEPVIEQKTTEELRDKSNDINITISYEDIIIENPTSKDSLFTSSYLGKNENGNGNVKSIHTT